MSKRRNGFVTNSSSSSFICDVCGEVESGYDMTLEEAGMYECVNGHTFCRMEALKTNREEMEKFLVDEEIYEKEDLEKMSDEEVEKEFYPALEGHDNVVPSGICPICQLKNCKVDDALRYLMIKFKYTEEDILHEWKRKFGSYEAVQTFLYNNKKKITFT